MSADAPIRELKALAHPLRFRIVELLQSGERNVGEIEQASGIAQPALSQQLGILRKAGLVATRRDAKLVFYRLDDNRIGELAARIGGFTSPNRATAATPRRTVTGAANFARLT